MPTSTKTRTRSGQSPFPGRYIQFISFVSQILILLQGYQRADLVTSEELALIKKVDRQSKPKIESLLLSDGQTYALLYLRLLKKLQRVDTMQYILVLIADALAGKSLFTTAEPDFESYVKTTMNVYPCSPEHPRTIPSYPMDLSSSVFPFLVAQYAFPLTRYQSIRYARRIHATQICSDPHRVPLVGFSSHQLLNSIIMSTVRNDARYNLISSKSFSLPFLRWYRVHHLTNTMSESSAWKLCWHVESVVKLCGLSLESPLGAFILYSTNSFCNAPQPRRNS